MTTCYFLDDNRDNKNNGKNGRNAWMSQVTYNWDNKITVVNPATGLNLFL